MKIAVVGLGYWGPNLVRNFLWTKGVDGVVGCDVVEKRHERLRQQFPKVEFSTSFDEVLGRSDVHAIALATPVGTHFPLGMRALDAGKHLLVEKPMTLSTADGEALIKCAKEHDLRLMVDHTFAYSSAVRKVKECISRGEIGDILYFDSVRVNLGLFQHDTNVIWDLAPHDVSILDFLVDQSPVSVSANGTSHYNGHEDIAYLTVHFKDSLIAHFHVNWISPVKVRRILIGGTKLMVVYDDMEPSEKIKLYDRGVVLKGSDSIHKALVEYRIGEMRSPRIDQTEALSLMAAEFVRSILTGDRPLTDGRAGLNVVRILEAADVSLQLGGQTVQLSTNGKGESDSDVSRSSQVAYSEAS